MFGDSSSLASALTHTYVQVDVYEDWLVVHVDPGGREYRIANDPKGAADLIHLCQRLHVTNISMNGEGGRSASTRHSLALAGISVTVANRWRENLFAQKTSGFGKRRLATIVAFVGLVLVSGFAAWRWSSTRELLVSTVETTKRFAVDASERFDSKFRKLPPVTKRSHESTVVPSKEAWKEKALSLATSGSQDRHDSGMIAGEAAHVQQREVAQVLQEYRDSLAYRIFFARSGSHDLPHDPAFGTDYIGRMRWRENQGNFSPQFLFADSIVLRKPWAPSDYGTEIGSHPEISRVAEAAQPSNSRLVNKEHQGFSISNTTLGEVRPMRGNFPGAHQLYRDKLPIMVALSALERPEALRGLPAGPRWPIWNRLTLTDWVCPIGCSR